MYLFYLDAYHQEDPLFVQELARALKNAPSRPPCLLVHTSGERGERMIEATGAIPMRDNGVLQPADAEQQRLLERAIREDNRRLVGTLTDEVVPAVGIHGADRRLLRLGDTGHVEVGKIAWLQALMTQGVIPVISATYADTDGVLREVPPAKVLRALTEKLTGTVVFFNRGSQPGLRGADGQPMSVRVATDLPGSEVLPEPEVVRATAEAAVSVWVSRPRGWLRSETPVGTRILMNEP